MGAHLVVINTQEEQVVGGMASPRVHVTFFPESIPFSKCVQC